MSPHFPSQWPQGAAGERAVTRERALQALPLSNKVGSWASEGDGHRAGGGWAVRSARGPWPCDCQGGARSRCPPAAPFRLRPGARGRLSEHAKGLQLTAVTDDHSARSFQGQKCIVPCLSSGCPGGRGQDQAPCRGFPRKSHPCLPGPRGRQPTVVSLVRWTPVSAPPALPVSLGGPQSLELGPSTAASHTCKDPVSTCITF